MQLTHLSRRFTSVSRSSRGFTLVEVVVVGVLLAILAAIGLPAILDAIQGSTARATLAKMKMINDAKARAAVELAAAGTPVTETDEPAFSVIAPFLSQGGVQPASATAFMAGSGGRTLTVGAWNAACSVTPAVPTKYITK